METDTQGKKVALGVASWQLQITFCFGQAELSYFGSSWETFGLRGLGQCFLDLNVY